MVLKVRNTLTGETEEFSPLEKGKVKMYVCGPTVYDVAHLGHGRSAVAFDVIRRYLLWKKFDVTFVFNITDVDDKIIQRAKEKDITEDELVEQIIPEYDKDFGALNVLPPTIMPRATEHVEQMIDLVRTLEKKGHAYPIEGEGMYFDVTTFGEYGKLSHQKLEDLQAGARVEVDERKKNPYDFCLWKAKKEGEPSWTASFACGDIEGRPGWHIECSAMSTTHLGETFDIHGGGRDLVFPHHECEIAQSESATGKRFANYWLHNGFVKVDEEKMSKSLGNFKTLKDIFEEYDPLVVRYFLLSTHYTMPINFSPDLLEQAKSSLGRLRECYRRLSEYEGDPSGVDVDDLVRTAREKFSEAMDDDFEISSALGAVFDFVREVNGLMDGSSLSTEEARKALEFLDSVDHVLACIITEDEEIPEEIINLAEKREEARKSKDFELADSLRDEIVEKGYQVDDEADGFRIRKA